MQRITIKRGLDLPISGAPRQEIAKSEPGSVAVLGCDYVGMKPTMAVNVGDRVREGQLLFEDKKTPGVRYTSPGCGSVVAINRGRKRAFLSLVIELEGHDPLEFQGFDKGQLAGLPADKIKAQLLETGLWTALRQRPFGKVPSPQTVPHSIFVTAIDTNPLAAAPEPIIAERPDEFIWGLTALSRLTEGKLFLCVAPGSRIPGTDLEGVTPVEFAGPHPAGLPGTHIHFLDPVGSKKTVWYVNYQDVMAIGSSLVSGRLDVRRVVALGGPGIRQPRLLRTRLGACICDLIFEELVEGNVRVVSGSVFHGHKVQEPLNYLGRYHLQISALAEGSPRELLGWYRPAFWKHSVKNVVGSALFAGRKFDMTTSLYGGHRAIVPIGSYEKVMPLDILPTFLLKALAMDDIDQIEALGALELDEEDLALCTYVCPGKGDYGAMLRRNLTTMEKEG